MAYLYGDSTESPLEFNYIEFLRDALDFAVEILVSDYRVEALQESGEEQKRGAEVEIQQLRLLGERVSQLMADPVGAPQSPAHRCAAQIRQGAEDAILRMATQVKQGLSDHLGQIAGQIQRERASALRAIEMLLRHRDMPDSAWQLEVMLSGSRAGYTAQLRGRAGIGLEWVQALEIPTSHLFAQIVRVERLAPNIEVRLPEKGGGWMRKGARVRAHRVGGSCVVEMIHAPHQTTIKLRAAPEEDETGYNVLVSSGQPRVRLVQVLKGGEHSPPFEPPEEDVPRFLELAHLLTEAADDLTRHRAVLREARIDGKSVAEWENPSVLVQRLVAKMAPVVTEIARHSLTADELVLKRVLTDDRREEIFAAKADLIAKLEPVPLALRGVFAPLGLGNLGLPGQVGGSYADESGAAWPARTDGVEPVVETIEVPPPARAGELPPPQGLPGVGPAARGAVRPGESRGPGHPGQAGQHPGKTTSRMGTGALLRAAPGNAQSRGAPGNALSRAATGNAHPQVTTMRGMNPPQAPGEMRSFDPNDPPADATQLVPRPPTGESGADVDDVTLIAEQEDLLDPEQPRRDNSVDVALSELERET